MRFWVFLAAGWLVLAAPPCAHADGAPLTDVDAALGQARYREAETLAGNALADAGLDSLRQSRLHIARGLARQAQGEGDDALVDFTQALSASDLPAAERAVALFDRGVTLDGLGRLDDAVGDYSAVLRLTPNASHALNNRANVYRRQGRLEDARRDYLAALADDRGHAQYPYYGLGQIAEAKGDMAAARDFYTRALASDPAYQLAADRLQALGAADWAPAAPGVIVLRPPPAATPIVLHPPPPRAVSQMPDVAAAETVALRAPAAKPGVPRQAPLRPAIVESPGRASKTATQGPLVQLGAWRSEAEAQAGWEHAQGQAGGLLDGLAPHIVAADVLDRGRYYRLQLVPGMPAPKFCAALVAKGLACFPVRD